MQARPHYEIDEVLEMKRKITVIGSVNMDLVTLADRTPKAGETILGKAFHTIPGGKGANQAVAAARLGAEATFIGCVGDDDFGRLMTQRLQDEGINIDYVKPVTHVSTGIAAITISEGDNRIIVVPGANSHVTAEYVQKHEEVIAASDAIVLQLEIPVDGVKKAMELARKHRVKIILNPAPFQVLSKEMLLLADYLTPNEHEQAELLAAGNWTEAEREEILQKCIVTRGAAGASIYQNGEKLIPGYPVEAVDTTGAGDTFNGALAFSLSGNADLEEACRFANAAGALSVTKLGAQGGMPTSEEVAEFLQRQEG